MSDKYIIRNCPCRIELHENDCFGYTGYNNCCACTDCLLKQIVEKCRERYGGFLEESFIKDEILNLLQIEEIE